MRRIYARMLYAIRSRLFLKMLFIYSLLTLVPLIVVGATFYVRTSQLMEKSETEAQQQSLSKTASFIDDSLYEGKKKLLELGRQQPIHGLLKQAFGSWPDVTEQERLRTIASTNEFLAAELGEAQAKIGDIVDNIYLLDIHGEVYAAAGGPGLEFVKAYTVYPFEFDRMSEWAFFTDFKRMVCVLEIYAEGPGSAADQLVGFTILSLNTAKVAALYEQFEADTFYITNSDNLVVSASKPEQIGQVLDVRGPADLLVMKQKSQYSDFQYVRLARPGSGNIVEKQAVFSLGVTLFTWIVVFFATSVILRKITNPIQRLTRLMRKAEREEYQLMPEAASPDEIAQLCKGYNQLVIRTEELIRKNYKSELAAREAELRAIRMYVNPHFLYNMMGHISIMSQHPDKVKFVPDVTQKLSHIFRFSILPGDSFVTLETELSICRKYLEIHKYRFGDRLRFAIQLPSMLQYVEVPRLILQPLVENCIIHGIEKLTSGGSIEIEAKEEDYQLVIRIANDTPAAEDRQRKSRDDRRGLGSGLDNVNARIAHYFGSEYGVSIATVDNITTATVRMPIQLREEREEK